jgi:Fe-S cluster biogenesis protein NfuA
LDRLKVAETPNPNCMRFYSDELSLLPIGKTLDLPDREHQDRSPLAAELFNRCSEIVALFYADSSFTVTKEPNAAWDQLSPKVQLIVLDHIANLRPLLTPLAHQELHDSFDDTAILPTDDECVQVIKELIAKNIRPMLQQDGGNIKYIGMELDGTVYVLLEGACRSCPSSGHTLKDGIERVLSHFVPEVFEVREVDQAFARHWRQENSIHGAEVATGNAVSGITEEQIQNLGRLMADMNTPVFEEDIRAAVEAESKKGDEVPDPSLFHETGSEAIKTLASMLHENPTPSSVLKKFGSLPQQQQEH